ncbi:MAG: Lysophospholipase [Moraxellaceae bacterium]|jgi:acylglycerol lipase|nr:Lysophospholipase [Moraxellaceae bacterium]
MNLPARTLVLLCLRLVAILSLLGLAACTALPPASPLPTQYTVYPGAEPGLLKTADGLTLFSQWWVPKAAEPRAVVLLLHGTAAHAGVYAPWAEYLTSQGYAMFAFDLRGWGQSQGFGRRAFVRSHEDYVDDLAPAFAEVQRRFPGKPVFLQGESLGAAVALQASIRGGLPAQGLILNAPPVYVNFKIGPGRWPNWLATPSLWMAGRIGWVAPNAPIWPMQSEWALSWIWNKAIFDDFSRQMLKEEPHITHSAVAAVYVTALAESAANIRRNISAIKEPFIVLQGDKDYLVSTPGSGRVLMEEAGSTDKTRKIYPGMSHCTLHDRNRGAVWADIVAWLDARVPAQPLSDAAVQLRLQGQALTKETPAAAYARMLRDYRLATWQPGAPWPATAVPAETLAPAAPAAPAEAEAPAQATLGVHGTREPAEAL